MKKVIDGKMYDTEKAAIVKSWDNGRAMNDFDWYSETLHRKRTGEFFLHLEGGARTPLAELRDHSSWVGGAQVQPLSFDEARAWAESRLSGEDYEDVFGMPEDGTAAISAVVSAAAKAKLDNAAAKMGSSRSEVLEKLLMAL